MKRKFLECIRGSEWSSSEYDPTTDSGVTRLAVMPVPGGWLTRSEMWRGRNFNEGRSREVFADTFIPDPGHTDPEWRELHADYFDAQATVANTSENT